MMRIMVAGGLIISAMVLDLSPARANDNAPWCAVISIGTGNAVWDCQYRTIEECVPNVLAGNRGFCNHNPRYEVPMARQNAHGRRRLKRD
jgi:hypothetical protein